MSTTEKVLSEMNECRTNPTKYSQKLLKVLKYYRGKIFMKPGYEAIETEEGSANVIACSSYLKSIMPVTALEWSPSLTLAAQLHADDIGPSGRMTHIGEDGSEPCDRIERFCRWSGHLGENIDYGNADPEDIVISLMIDDGVLARGQRLNIMKREHKYAGVGFGYHSEYQYVCVILFAELVIENTSSITPSVSSIRKIKKSEYVKVKEITEEESKSAKKAAKKLETIELPERKEEISQDEIIEIKEFFDRLDKGSSGSISVTEIKQVLESPQPEVSESSVVQMLLKLDVNTINTLDFEGLLSMISQGKKLGMKESEQNNQIKRVSHVRQIAQLSEDMVDEIKDIFDCLDSDKSGLVDIETIKHAINTHQLDSYNTSLLELIRGIKDTSSAKLSFGKFIEIISTVKHSESSLSEFYKCAKVPRSELNSYETHHSVRGKVEKAAEFNMADYIIGGITREQVIEIKSAFDMFDSSRKGFIDTNDLKAAMEDQGFKRKNPTVYKLVSDLNVKGSGIMDFKEFFRMLTERNIEPDAEDEIKQFFDLFDREGLGYIELRNLKKVAKELGESLDEDDIVDLIRKSDLDGDGKVTYADFYNIMSKVL